MRAVHPRRVAGLAIGADGQRVARDIQGEAEEVPPFRVGRLDISLLAPDPGTAREHIGGSRGGMQVVGLIAVDAGGAARFLDGTDGDRVAGNRHGGPEAVARVRVGSLQIGLLAPHARGAGEDVGCAGQAGGVVALVTVDPGRVAFFAGSADHDGVAVNIDRHAENVLDIGIGRFQVGLLAPHTRRSSEHIGGA